MLGEDQLQYTGRHEGLTVRFKDVSALFAGYVTFPIIAVDMET